MYKVMGLIQITNNNNNNNNNKESKRPYRTEKQLLSKGLGLSEEPQSFPSKTELSLTSA
jgi:hypothetical protein